MGEALSHNIELCTTHAPCVRLKIEGADGQTQPQIYLSIIRRSFEPALMRRGLRLPLLRGRSGKARLGCWREGCMLLLARNLRI